MLLLTGLLNYYLLKLCHGDVSVAAYLPCTQFHPNKISVNVFLLSFPEFLPSGTGSIKTSNRGDVEDRTFLGNKLDACKLKKLLWCLFLGNSILKTSAILHGAVPFLRHSVKNTVCLKSTEYSR